MSRKFVDVVKVRKKHQSSRANPKSLADKALDYIGKLYHIENQAQVAEMTPDQRYRLRRQEAKPVLDQFKQWLDAKQPLTPPQGLLGQAISYTLSNWDKLIVYIEKGWLKPDNNVAENAIRPFVLGRKNRLFASTPMELQPAQPFLA